MTLVRILRRCVRGIQWCVNSFRAVVGFGHKDEERERALFTNTSTTTKYENANLKKVSSVCGWMSDKKKMLLFVCLAERCTNLHEWIYWWDVWWLYDDWDTLAGTDGDIEDELRDHLTVPFASHPVLPSIYHSACTRLTSQVTLLFKKYFLNFFC